MFVNLCCFLLMKKFTIKASKNRLFSMENYWILINSQQNLKSVDTAKVAQETFEICLSEAYVLPESNVILFVKIDDNAWELWEGFKVGKMEKIRVYKHGTATSGGLQLLNDSIALRSDLQGITLKATTVVRKFIRFQKKISTTRNCSREKRMITHVFV